MIELIEGQSDDPPDGRNNVFGGIRYLVLGFNKDYSVNRAAEVVALHLNFHRRVGDVVDRYLACTKRLGF